MNLSKTYSLTRAATAAAILAASIPMAASSASAATTQSATTVEAAAYRATLYPGCKNGLINTDNVTYSNGNVDYAAKCRAGYFKMNFSASKWISARTHCRYWGLSKSLGCSSGYIPNWHRECRTFRDSGTIQPAKTAAYWDSLAPAA